MEVVGVVPAGGRAARLGALPCSKEVLPVGWEDGPDGPRAVAAAEYLLRRMALSGVRRAFVVVGHGKWDVPAYLGEGTSSGLELAYVTVSNSPSTPATVARAAPFVFDADVAFGFPDILFAPDDAFAHLLARRADGGADVVLGAFPAERPETADMLDVDDRGRVRRIAVKSPATGLRLAWILAVWGPPFTRFLAEVVARGLDLPRELYVGDVLQAALHEGLRVEAVELEGGRFRDLGTPEDARAAMAGDIFAEARAQRSGG